jgi:hypothetical protein
VRLFFVSNVLLEELMALRAIDLRLQKPLEDYVAYFDHLTPRSLNLLEQVGDITMAFVDPVYNVRGLDRMLKILRRRYECYPQAKYTVHDFMWGRRPATAYLRWSLLCSPKDSPVHGMVDVGFSPEGKICSHIEFWQDTRMFNLKAFQKQL